MAQSAKVTSIDALDTFKANLIVYLEKTGRILDGVCDDVVRTRIWLQTDRQLHWKNLIRQRTRALAQAEQELLTARLSGLPEAIKIRRLAANKAKLAVEEAENGLARVRQWVRQYETQVESHAKVVSKLRQTLALDMGKAVAFLDKAATALADYAGISPPARTAATRDETEDAPGENT